MSTSKKKALEEQPVERKVLTAAQLIIKEECGELCEMLLQKNSTYGNSALDPVRIFSRANNIEQIKVRIDDKLSRIAHGAKGFDDEDTELDLIGYLILLRVASKLSGKTST